MLAPGRSFSLNLPIIFMAEPLKLMQRDKAPPARVRLSSPHSGSIRYPRAWSSFVNLGFLSLKFLPVPDNISFLLTIASYVIEIRQSVFGVNTFRCHFPWSGTSWQSLRNSNRAQSSSCSTSDAVNSSLPHFSRFQPGSSRQLYLIYKPKKSMSSVFWPRLLFSLVRSSVIV